MFYEFNTSDDSKRFTLSVFWHGKNIDYFITSASKVQSCFSFKSDIKDRVGIFIKDREKCRSSA